MKTMKLFIINGFFTLLLICIGQKSIAQDCNTNCTTGSINLQAVGGGYGSGARVEIQKPITYAGGSINLKAGPAAYTGGYITLEAGSSGLPEGTPGMIILKGGDRSGSTNDGAVEVQRGNFRVMTKILVGTTNESQDANAKVIVDGKIVCEEIEAKGVAADFVFNKGYKLRSLSEVESFINNNKHLPDVPNAETTKKGVNLGDFSELLLQKVEELTLYVIEQNKSIELLKRENEVMKKTLTELK